MLDFKDFFIKQERGYSTQEVISFYFNKMKLTEISSLTNKSIGEIYRILHNNNVTPNRLKTNHHNVIFFADAGMPITQIAQLTGYTERNVRNILHARPRN